MTDVAFGLHFGQDRFAAVIRLDALQLLTDFNLLHHFIPIGSATRRLTQLVQLGNHIGRFARTYKFIDRKVTPLLQQLRKTGQTARHGLAHYHKKKIAKLKAYWGHWMDLMAAAAAAAEEGAVVAQDPSEAEEE